MKIAIIGSGYVGLVSGICFAKLGHEIVCVDKDEKKISSLKSGVIPIFEPGLAELLAEVVQARKISFTTDLRQALQNSAAVFIAVGTPQGEDGSADLSYVLAAAEEIAEICAEQKIPQILIVTKSTVPVGTGAKIKRLVRETAPAVDFLVASNPEFLREGAAIDDFMHPDRIVIGVADEKSRQIFAEIYQKFPTEKLIITDIASAELIKYAANSFLATKIAFINEMADLCEEIGADVKQLARGIGLDSRIGEKFLNPGPGFGGSCFPKDILAILKVAKDSGVKLSLIDQVIASNKNRQLRMVQKISAALGRDVRGKKIALLGLAFKANTDDIRYSPAIAIAKELLKKGAIIRATDPEAIENSRRELSGVEFFSDAYEAAKGSDVVVIATEWQQYRELDLARLGGLVAAKKIVDLRNVLDAKKVDAAGFEYGFIGGK